MSLWCFRMPYESNRIERFQDGSRNREPSRFDIHLRLGMVSASSSSSEMACGEARRQLVDYMEGDLERAAAARLLKHLKICPQCEAVLRGIQNVTGLLGQLVEFE